MAMEELEGNVWVQWRRLAVAGGGQEGQQRQRRQGLNFHIFYEN
jgi:hypothetical protein